MDNSHHLEMITGKWVYDEQSKNIKLYSGKNLNKIVSVFSYFIIRIILFSISQKKNSTL